MLSEYLEAAMHQARYEILPDDGTFYGEIPGFDGVYANATALEACRDGAARGPRGMGAPASVAAPSPPRGLRQGFDHRSTGVVPPFGPITRPDVVPSFRQLGFDGPYSGGKHQYREGAQSSPGRHRTRASCQSLATGRHRSSDLGAGLSQARRPPSADPEPRDRWSIPAALRD